SNVKIVDGFETKIECLEYLTGLLAESGCLQFADRFLAAVKGREEIMSTGIGREVAIPHARDLMVNTLRIAVCLIKKPLDFNAIDNLSVKVVFMIAVPQNSNQQYMMILRSISEYLKQEDKRLALLASKTEEELFSNVGEIEHVISKNTQL
ncbi:MAG: PTS sugar transporter subunit IIA, partial [Candidatus Cloacimonetes bacterium]|nr:PTS sugar transporter subunit IIA [Candidatus Cloacimonadota bacterium]